MSNVRVTSQQVAQKAGVSQSAVSRVFTPGASASIKTIEKVQVEAEDKKIPIDLNGLDYTKGTEELVKEIMGRFYKNEK